MKETIEAIQREIVDLTRVMKEKAEKGQSEYQELTEKLAELMKEKEERKFQHDTGIIKSVDEATKRQYDMKMDELLIARALCTDTKSGTLDREAYGKIVLASEYLDAVKGSGFTVDANTNTSAADFVPPAFSATLLTDIFLKLELAALFGRITMPAPSYTFPFNADRITARLTGEGAASEKENFTTAKIVFNAKKIMSTVEFTDELEMDSIISILPFVRTKLVEAFALAQEQICFNGDTTDTLNGGVGVTPADDARRAAKGIRALANAGEKVDFASGGFSADNLRSLRVKMGKYGKNPKDLAYVISMSDYLKSLSFSGYQALYQYAGAVTTAGELGRLDNIPLVITELIPTNLDASGNYNVAGTKTTCGLVHKDAYLWGDRKQFGLETFRNPFNQTFNLIGSERLDFEKIMSAAAPTAAFGVNY